MQLSLQYFGLAAKNNSLFIFNFKAMKHFIFKILFFITIPIFLYTTIGIFLKIKFRNNIENYQTIILGDSQTEFIRFPEIYNRSIYGSPYYVHYEFAKEFIEEIKGKRVYIACNYHNLSKLYQNRLANDTLLIGWRANTFKTLDEYNILNYKYSDIRPKDLKYSFFEIKKIPRLFKSLYFSSENINSLNSVINDTLSINNSIQRHWRHPGYVLDDSIQETYLEKLILLLKENNCQVILLKMPLTNYYMNNVPPEIKMKLIQLPNDYKIRLLDLNNYLEVST
jgi:hypothetical protein